MAHNHRISVTYSSTPGARQRQGLRYVRHYGSKRYARRAAYPPSLALDSSKDFTITLVTAPVGTIQSVTAPSTAGPGDSIQVSVVVRNTGNGAGRLWCQIVDRDTGVLVAPKQTTGIDIPVGADSAHFFTLTMPSKTWNLRAEAGHGTITAPDSTKDFTITLVTAPFATIDSVTAPTEAAKGASITISVAVRNTGSGTGSCHGQIVDRDTGAVVGSDSYVNLAPGATGTLSWSGLTMPDHDWHLRAEAWH